MKLEDLRKVINGLNWEAIANNSEPDCQMFEVAFIELMHLSQKDCAYLMLSMLQAQKVYFNQQEMVKYSEWILNNCVQYESDYWIVNDPDKTAASAEGLLKIYQDRLKQNKV